MSTLEAALFESGRPILIAPPDPPRSARRHVVIAWNGSTETARAIAFAMPFLHQAQRVVVLIVEGGMVAGPRAASSQPICARTGSRPIDAMRSRAGAASARPSSRRPAR